MRFLRKKIGRERVKIRDLVPLRVLKVKITTAGVMVVPFRVLSRKYERR